MFSKILLRFIYVCALMAGAQFFVCAQDTKPFFKGALKENREKFYNNVIRSIKVNMSLPLNGENEENWINALDAVNLVNYRSPFVTLRVDHAVKNITGRSREFKKSLLALLNNQFPKKYPLQLKPVFKNANDDVRLMAMAANYIISAAVAADIKMMKQLVFQKLKTDPENAVLYQLNDQLQNWGKKQIIPALNGFFAPGYLPGQVLVFSFQREDRNFPGLAIVRKADGSFMKNEDGSFFSVGQLARSGSNMPGYISMGNTPQGIFRMDGFDTSKSYFIGPTTNIQLTMPFEYKMSHFYRDSTLIDSVWTPEDYAALLPQSFKNYHPLFGTYFAGKAGRNEIICHGTTIDPAYYKNTSFYPYTPTAGCLATKEFWNEKTGRLQISEQLLLTQAVQNAGGPKGYLIVVEINDKQAPVLLKEIEPLLRKSAPDTALIKNKALL